MKKILSLTVLIALVITLTAVSPVFRNPQRAEAGEVTCQQVLDQVIVWQSYEYYMANYAEDYSTTYVLWVPVDSHYEIRLFGITYESYDDVPLEHMVFYEDGCYQALQALPETATCTSTETEVFTMTVEEFMIEYGPYMYDSEISVDGWFPFFYKVTETQYWIYYRYWGDTNTVEVHYQRDFTCTWPDATGCLGLKARDPQSVLGQALEFYWFDGSQQWSPIVDGGYTMNEYGDVDYVAGPRVGGNAPLTIQGRVGGVPVVEFNTSESNFNAPVACEITWMNSDLLEVRQGSTPTFAQ